MISEKILDTRKSYLKITHHIKETTSYVGAGHYPWFENPNQIAQAFEEFYAMKLKSKT